MSVKLEADGEVGSEASGFGGDAGGSGLDVADGVVDGSQGEGVVHGLSEVCGDAVAMAVGFEVAAAWQ